MGEPIAETGELAGVCGHDGSNWAKALIDEEGRLVVAVGTAVTQNVQLYGWDGDSWEKLLVDGSSYLKVTLPLEEALGARAYQYDGASWRRSNLLLGFNAKVMERVDDTNASAGTNTLDGAEVGAGKLWVITNIIVYNDTTAPSIITTGVFDGTTFHTVCKQPSPGLKVGVTYQGQLVMEEGDNVRTYIAGCVAGDDIYLFYQGYEMDIEM